MSQRTAGSSAEGELTHAVQWIYSFSGLVSEASVSPPA